MPLTNSKKENKNLYNSNFKEILYNFIMFDKIRKFKYYELTKKLCITFIILAVYKVLSQTPLPGIATEAIEKIAEKSGYFEMMNFTGGGPDKCSLLTLGLQPYITATIITQILSSKFGFEEFQKMKKDRELGSSRLNSWTKVFTLIIAFINAIYYLSVILSMHSDSGKLLVFESKKLFYIVGIPLLMCGSMIAVWLSSQITKHGIGQGTSFLIFANIVSSSFGSLSKLKAAFKEGTISLQNILVIFGFFITMFIFCIFVESCIRNIAVRYLGIKGTSDIRNMPLKINNAGVMTVIMASTLVSFPQMLIWIFSKMRLFTETLQKYSSYINVGGAWYYVFYGLVLVLITLSQTEIVFDTEQVATNLQETGIILPGKRPGEETEAELKKILNFLNILASIYLVILCIGSEYCCNVLNSIIMQDIIRLAGNSLLIIVSTSREIFKSIIFYNYEELMNNYYKKNNIQTIEQKEIIIDKKQLSV